MTEKEVREKLEEASYHWEDFDEWMCGQTAGLNPDGTIDYYESDVDRFIRNMNRMRP